jgi:hypothetical protein
MTKLSKEEASEVALKQHFVDRAEALSRLPEVFRSAQVALLIRDMVALGVRAEEDIFQAAYDDRGGQKYWEALLSEPISVFSLAHILSGHLADSVEQLEAAQIAIIGAFRVAAETGERWFIGQTASFLAVQHGQTSFQELAKVKVHARAAVEWLLGKPKREHLVPESLRRFLESYTPTARRIVTKNIAERFVADYIRTEQRRGDVLPLPALKLLRKKPRCTAVESFSDLPSVSLLR